MFKDRTLFIVTCHGWSASNWLATVLNMHPDISCVHSVGEALTEEKKTFSEEEKLKFSQKNHTEGRQNKTLIQHFEDLSQRFDSPAIGSVHRYRLRDLPNLLQHSTQALQFQLANLLRHPVKLVNSGTGQYDKLAQKDPFTRYEILTFFNNNHQFYTHLAETYDLDLCDWLTMSFMAACQHMFVLAQEANMFQGVNHVKMEELTEKPEVLTELLHGLTLNQIEITQDYLNEVYAVGPTNSHRQHKETLTPEAQYKQWEPWQKEAFQHFMEQSGIKLTYTQLGYDLSFV